MIGRIDDKFEYINSAITELFPLKTQATFCLKPSITTQVDNRLSISYYFKNNKNIIIVFFSLCLRFRLDFKPDGLQMRSDQL